MRHHIFFKIAAMFVGVFLVPKPGNAKVCSDTGVYCATNADCTGSECINPCDGLTDGCGCMDASSALNYISGKCDAGYCNPNYTGGGGGGSGSSDNCPNHTYDYCEDTGAANDSSCCGTHISGYSFIGTCNCGCCAEEQRCDTSCSGTVHAGTLYSYLENLGFSGINESFKNTYSTEIKTAYDDNGCVCITESTCGYTCISGYYADTSNCSASSTGGAFGMSDVTNSGCVAIYGAGGNTGPGWAKCTQCPPYCGCMALAMYPESIQGCYMPGNSLLSCSGDAGTFEYTDNCFYK